MNRCTITLVFLFLVLLTPVLGQETSSSINLQPHIFYQLSTACEPATFIVELQNTGELPETYELSVDTFTEETTLLPERTILAGKTSENITLTVKPSDCTLIGRQVIPFKATTQTGEELVLDLTLDISEEGVPIIAPGVERITTDHSKKTAVIPVQNKGTQPQRFTTTFEGEPWMSIRQQAIEIDPEGQQHLNLILEPPEDQPEEEYTATIHLKGNGKTYTKTFIVQLGIVYTTAQRLTFVIYGLGSILSLIILSIIGHSIHRSRTTQREQARERRALIRETRIEHFSLRQRIRHERKRLNTERKERTAERKKQKELARQQALEEERKKTEREQFKLRRTLEQELRKDYHLIPKTSIVSKKRPALKRVLERVLLLIIVALVGTSAYLLKDQLPIFGIAVGSCAALLFTIAAINLLLNKRRITAKRKLLVAGEQLTITTRWRTGTQQATLIPAIPAKKLSFTVSKKRTCPPSPHTIYSYTTLSVNIDALTIEHVHTTSLVSERWLQRHNATPEDLTAWQYHNNKWKEIPCTITPAPGNSTVDIETKHLGTLAIGLKQKKTATKKTAGPGILGYTSLALLLVCGIFLLTQFLPERVPTTEIGIPRQTWPQDTEHTLDLTSYFADPDGDTLEFKATKVQNIAIEFIDKKALFSPDPGFFGTREVIFSASDDKETVKSNTVKLIITKNYIPNHFKPYIQPIIIVLMLILLLIVIIQFRPKKIKQILEK